PRRPRLRRGRAREGRRRRRQRRHRQRPPQLHRRRPRPRRRRMEGGDVPMTKTTYKVTGPTAFMDHQPGETFEADLDPDLEERALERGSIEVVAGRSTRKKTKEDGDA